MELEDKGTQSTRITFNSSLAKKVIMVCVVHMVRAFLSLVVVHGDGRREFQTVLMHHDIETISERTPLSFSCAAFWLRKLSRPENCIDACNSVTESLKQEQKNAHSLTVPIIQVRTKSYVAGPVGGWQSVC